VIRLSEARHVVGGGSPRPLRTGSLLVVLAVLASAVAGCGGPSDADRTAALLETAVSASGRMRIEATDAVLTLAERLADAGDTETAERIYRTLWDASGALDRRHVRCAAVRGLAHILGPAAVDDLAEAIAGGDPQVRAAAMRAAAEAPGEDVTRAWVERLGTAKADMRPVILRILGRRGGPAADEAVLAALESDRKAERLAAVEAVVRLETPAAVGPLVGLLASADPAEREAARLALARLPAEAVSRTVAEHLPAAEPAVREQLIGVLLARAAREQAGTVAACLKDGPAGVQAAAARALAILGGEAHMPALLGTLRAAEDTGVRQATQGALARIARRSDAGRFTGQVIAAMNGAGAEARTALVRLLGQAPTAQGLEAVRRAVRDPGAAVRETAVRVLADWPGTAAADDLLAIARKAEERKHRALALRGYIRRAGEAEAPAARVAMYRRALEAAERVQEQRLALAGLATVASPRALDLARMWMKREPLRAEAAAAVVAIAERIGRDHPVEAEAALEAVLERVAVGNLRARAERVLRDLRSRRRSRG